MHKFKKGDRVKVVKRWDSDKFQLGDILTVDEDSYSPCCTRESDGENHPMLESELELVVVSENPPLKKGDRVRVLECSSTLYKHIPCLGTVSIDLDDLDDVYLCVTLDESLCSSGEHCHALKWEAVEEEKKPEVFTFKVGDRIQTPSRRHVGSQGPCIGIITEIDKDNFVNTKNGDHVHYLSPREIRECTLIEEPQTHNILSRYHYFPKDYFKFSPPSSEIPPDLPIINWTMPSWDRDVAPKKPKRKEGKMATLSRIASKLLDADTRVLVKAGVLNSELDVEDESFVMAFLVNLHKKELAIEARKMLKEQKGKDEEE